MTLCPVSALLQFHDNFNTAGGGFRCRKILVLQAWQKAMLAPSGIEGERARAITRLARRHCRLPIHIEEEK
ncbi:MAG TPA: hypothetical protein VEC01_07060 [Noviherbaspirillum sp.]|uniref:hypothetical protein n=1 Tax=Noviherbaspirillum sp. TaxID=1926288 RepID=UPI002D3ABFB9|nr:hypothetical protein [Noviherbaspirillum sp.]HYD95065.1 hypothetical protein [Noviherbaspirillum sp.]